MSESNKQQKPVDKKKTKKDKVSKEQKKPDPKKIEKKLEAQKKQEQNRLKRDKELQESFEDIIAEHISIGTTNAEKNDGYTLRCLLIVGLGSLLTIGGTIGTIAFSLDFIPTFVTAIVTIVGAASIAAGFYLFYKEFGTNWGMMLQQGNVHRFETPIYYADFIATDPETGKLTTYKCVEKAYFVPELDKIVLRCINTDIDEYYNKDVKQKYHSVQLSLFHNSYSFNGPLEVKVIPKVRQPVIASEEGADPDDESEYDGEAGVTDDDFASAE